MRETHQHRDPSNVDSDGAFHAPYNSPGPFSILGPQGTVNDPTPEITWEESAGATGYHVVVSTAPDLSEVVWEVSRPGASATTATLTVLLEDGTYYTGVTAQDFDDETEASNHGLAFTVEDPIPQMHLIFATSFQTALSTSTAIPPAFPRFGGPDAADWTVTFAGYDADLPGTENWNGLAQVYQAVLSCEGQDARDRLSIVAPVYNTNGELIADDSVDLWDGALANPVGYDEFGHLITSDTEVWTGSSATGGYSGGETCGSCWDNSSSSSGGRTGEVISAGPGWLAGGMNSCNQTARLYGVSPPLDALPMPAGPLADGGGPYSIVLGNPLTLDGSGSFDPNGDPLSYTWDLNDDGTFGDAVGSTPTLGWDDLTGFGITGEGDYPVALRVDDGTGRQHDDTTTLSVTASTVVDRHVFYHNSAFDAAAPDKTALLPDEPEPVATSANYTSYSRGLNGIMVDLSEVPDWYTPTADDFEFKVGNSNDPGTWTPAPAPVAATFPVAEDAGTDDSDRITIIWADHAIRNEWLQVTVLGQTYLGLAEPHVFYYGNAVGEACNSAADAQVTTTDLLLARNNPRNVSSPAAIDFPYDYDRDERVNATDVLLARNNQTNFLTRLNLIDLSAEKGSGVFFAEDASQHVTDTPTKTPDPFSLYRLAALEFLENRSDRQEAEEKIRAVDLVLMIEGE